MKIRCQSLGTFLLLLTASLCGHVAADIGVGVTTYMRGEGGAVEDNMYSFVGEDADIDYVLTPKNPDELFTQLQQLSERTGENISHLVIAGHGYGDYPAIKFSETPLNADDLDQEKLQDQVTMWRRVIEDRKAKGKDFSKPLAYLNEARKQLEKLQEWQETDVMSPGAKIVLINCETAKTEQGKKFVKDLGGILMKKGGQLFASEKDVVIDDLQGLRGRLLWLWADKGTSLGDVYIETDWDSYVFDRYGEFVGVADHAHAGLITDFQRRLEELLRERQQLAQEVSDWQRNSKFSASLVWCAGKVLRHMQQFAEACELLDDQLKTLTDIATKAQAAQKSIDTQLAKARANVCTNDADLNVLQDFLHKATADALLIGRLSSRATEVHSNCQKLQHSASKRYDELLYEKNNCMMRSMDAPSIYDGLSKFFGRYQDVWQQRAELQKRWLEHRKRSEAVHDEMRKLAGVDGLSVLEKFATQARDYTLPEYRISIAEMLKPDTSESGNSPHQVEQNHKRGWAAYHQLSSPQSLEYCARTQKMNEAMQRIREARDQLAPLKLGAIGQLRRECAQKLATQAKSTSSGGLFIDGPVQLVRGDSGTFSARDAGNKLYNDAEWATTDETVVRIDPRSGRFAANRAGVCTIIARKEDMAGYLRVRVQPAAAAPTKPECRSDDDCPIAYVCVEGRCLHLGKQEVLDNETNDTPECFSDSECALGERCVAGICTSSLTREAVGACVTQSDCALGQECINGRCSKRTASDTTRNEVLDLFRQREEQRQQDRLEREGDGLGHSRRGRIDSHELQHDVDKLRRRAEMAARKALRPASKPKAAPDSDDDIDPPPKPDVQPPAETKPPADKQPPLQPPQDTLQRDWYIFEVTAKWSSPYNGEACHWIFYNQNHGPAADIPRYQNVLEEMLRDMVVDKPYVDMNTLQITSEVYAGPSESKMEVPSGSSYWPLGVTR